MFFGGVIMIALIAVVAQIVRELIKERRTRAVLFIIWSILAWPIGMGIFLWAQSHYPLDFWTSESSSFVAIVVFTCWISPFVLLGGEVGEIWWGRKWWAGFLGAFIGLFLGILVLLGMGGVGKKQKKE
jgi:hypothetical protein